MATYYVSTSGNDSYTTTQAQNISTPWGTLHASFNKLVAGDILKMLGGTYTSGTGSAGISVSSRSGSSSNYIVVEPYNSTPVIFDCGSLNSSGDKDGLRMSNCQYWRINKLEIRNVNDQNAGPASVGTLFDCRYIYLTQLKGHDCGNGFRDFRGDYIYYTNCDMYQNADGAPGYGDLANGFWARVRNGGHLYYEGCRAWLNSDDGWDCFAAIEGSTVGGGDGYIYYTNCWAFYNGVWGSIIGNGQGFKTGATDVAPLVGIQRRLVNCLACSNIGASGNGSGYDDSFDNYEDMPHEIYNCIAYNNGEVGFNIRGSSGNDLIKNNLSWSNNGAYGQNYFTGNESSTYDHNSWQIIGASDSDFVSVDVDQLLRPRQTDGSLPVITAFHLASGSNLRNAGTPITGLLYDGEGKLWNSTPSMGAYEYGTSTPPTLVTLITVAGTGGATSISTSGGTLQMVETVTPSNATNKTVVWTVEFGTGSATIGSSSGLLTAVTNGTVTVRATATDGSNVSGTIVITITNQADIDIPLTDLTITAAGNATTIATYHGTLQFTITEYVPANATDKSVTWSVESITGQATITQTGLVTAVSNGDIYVYARANTDPNVYGRRTITISNQTILVTNITVSGAGNATTITTLGGTLQMYASVLPTNATNQTITWSVINGTGTGTISAGGLLTATGDGTVTVRAAATDGSSVVGTRIITISNQITIIPVTSITVYGTGNATTISTDNGTLQMNVTVLPSNATLKTVTWSIQVGSSLATLNSGGLLTAINNGSVTVRATANDGYGAYDDQIIIISNQNIVSAITVTGTGGATTITVDNGILQMLYHVDPHDATNQTIVWSIINGTGQASITTGGRLTAMENGTVTVRATATDGSGVYGELVVTISNQTTIIPVVGVTVNSFNNVPWIDVYHGTLQMSAHIDPHNATDQTVVWSVIPDTGTATIDQNGLLTAVSNGTVTVRATSNG
jgi:uncharacterized protein YjdB